MQEIGQEKGGVRRTQSERSEAMRQRLVDAALKCLQTDGYAGTTVSRIIEVAGVSRGAPLHHFSSKNALIAAAAEQLVKKVYGQMGRAMLGLQGSDNRLHDLIYQVWKGVLSQPEHIALSELLRASQRDPELADILQHVWSTAYMVLGSAADHYLEPLSDKDSVRQLMVLTQWLLRGMAEDLHLVTDPALFDHYLRLWAQILAMHLRPKEGVTTPPPRPAAWGLRRSPNQSPDED